jgi:hypothetical protein
MCRRVWDEGLIRWLFHNVKLCVKRMPGIQKVNRIRHNIIRMRELSDLIKGNRIVILHPYYGMKGDLALIRGIVWDVVRDLLEVYGTVRFGRTTAAAVASGTGVIMLYAPLALLRIPSSHEEYLAQVGTKTRNMIRKSERNGYVFEAFAWNDYLDAIYEINTSKEVRQSAPMRGWYEDKVLPRYHSGEEQKFRKYYGAFKDGKLCAYLHAVLCGDFVFFRHFIGHALHMPYGVMNGLISWTVREYIGNPQIRWLKYGELSKRPSTMHQFRKHAGFQGFATFLDMESDEELLKYAEKKVKTIWRL